MYGSATAPNARVQPARAQTRAPKETGLTDEKPTARARLQHVVMAAFIDPINCILATICQRSRIIETLDIHIAVNRARRLDSTFVGPNKLKNALPGAPAQ